MEPAGQNGIAAAVNEVANHARSLVRLEGELAALEVREKIAALSAGAALVVGGAVLAFFALGFALATLAAGLATFLPIWLSLLIVTLGLALVVAIVLAIGISLLRRGAPPVPEQAIAEAKATGEALRGASHG